MMRAQGHIPPSLENTFKKLHHKSLSSLMSDSECKCQFDPTRVKPASSSQIVDPPHLPPIAEKRVYVINRANT